MSQALQTALFTTQTKTQPQIRDDILRTLANHLRSIGIANPNVTENSDYWGIATGVANEICVGLSNGVINANNFMPDTAGGSFLDRWLALFNLSRAGATQSAGVIAPQFSLIQGYTFIAANSVLYDAVGLRYQVTTGGNYGPGNASLGQSPNLYVAVQSIDTGSAVDHANGDQLTWVSAPAFTAQQAFVGTTGGTDGLSGGNNSEVGNDEPPRSRLFATLQTPPGGGNWSEVNQWCQQSSPDVQAGFCYPALMGPSTVFFTVAGAAQVAGPFSSTSKNRDLPLALLNGTVIPYVQGKYSTRAAVVGASVVNQPTDCCFILSLPAAQTASPAGPGGGWVDGSPWPSNVSSVTAVTDSTHIKVAVPAQAGNPTAGVTHIAYLDPTSWTLYTAVVLAATGPVANVWTLTLDTPWPTVAVGNFVFPQAVQQANYVTAMFQGFANLGPGEWTAVPAVLKRAFRHPAPALAWPSMLDANFLRTMENAGPEVLTAQYGFRSAIAPTVPTVPTITLTDPLLLTSPAPNILVPRNLAFYAS
jgi:uncharacterized phage protein gp47/JayE